MFINFTNHPSAQWSAEQKAAAQAYGEVIDLAFPAIDPAADEAALDSLASAYAARILHMNPDAVLCQGEFTFVYRVVLRLEDSLPRLQLEDYKQGLHQILGNFVRNAVKFTTKGSITIGFSQRPGWVRFYVRDTGIGIPEEERAKIFDRFYKVDTFTQGTGLGLPICKNIAEQLGGRIGVDSAVGEGSCFRVEMPIAE